jgi:uncharacterized protein YjeT (DUF2065 family)
MDLTAKSIITVLGMVAVIEGLVLALAPTRIEDMLAFLRRLSVESRRYLGLGFVALGVAVVWLATRLGS